jgi:outer membrane lipoprotein-sorting protein
MTSLRYSVLAAALAVCNLAAAPAPAAQDSPTLASGLARMDRSAAEFKSLSAKLKKTTFTAVLNESSTEGGAILVRRPSAKDLRMLIDFTEPDPKTVAYANKKWQIYYPKINTVQEYDFGKQSALVDQALLLGFGTSSADLKKGYSLKYLGEDMVNGSKTSHLELEPKSAEAREHFTRVELWIGEAGNPVQQKVVQPSKDYYLVTYSDIQMNPRLDVESLKLHLPKGVKKEYPQR